MPRHQSVDYYCLQVKKAQLNQHPGLQSSLFIWATLVKFEEEEIIFHLSLSKVQRVKEAVLMEKLPHVLIPCSEE